MASERDPYVLSSPRIYLVRMVVFLILAGFVALILYRQIATAYMANPGLNSLILGVLAMGVVLGLRQVVRLFPEISWVNALRRGQLGSREPVLLAPMSRILGEGGLRAISTTTLRAILDSLGTRLDESREILRYMIGLLVFLGLLGTFWGLLETVGSIGGAIKSMQTGGDAAVMFDDLKNGLAAPISGMAVAFTSSLFGLAGSLVLGFLDLQAGQAQNRFYTELEDALSTNATDASFAPTDGVSMSPDFRQALQKLAEAADPMTARAATQAMVNLAEGIQGLVQHMRGEQQMLRTWVESQAEQQADIRKLLQRLAAEFGASLMALGRARRAKGGFDYWPGFVDALSTMLLVITFLLSVFMFSQYFLSREMTGKDTALQRLNQQIDELTSLLALERATKGDAQSTILSLQATLEANEREKLRLQGLADANRGGLEAAGSEASEARRALESERAISARAMAQVDILNQQISALRRQLAAIEEALNASERRDRESQARIADLGSRLNVALAQKVQELARYRSDFFGRLREILGQRPGIRVVGDRFVFESEVLFESGQSALNPQGRAELDKLAAAIADLEREIPPEIAWVMRVDGHTDKRPIVGRSNWDLSASRAIAVVQYLVTKGVTPQHLVAAGFGEFQPIDTGENEEAYRRNRRIELKLTER